MQRAKYISNGTITYKIIGDQGPQGPQGEVGAQGPVGPQGPAGSDGKICDFKFGSNFEEVKSSEWDQVHELSRFEQYLDQSVKYKNDGGWIVVEVQPLRQQRLDFLSGSLSGNDLTITHLPDNNRISTMVQKMKAANFPIIGVKFHNAWIRDNWSALSPFKDHIFDSYKTIINDVIDIIGEHIKVSFLNESPGILNDTSLHEYIKTILSSIKAKGCKAGLSGMRYTVANKAVFDYTDFLAVHYYPNISSKRENTTIDDSIRAWQCVGDRFETMERYHNMYPNNEVWIVEAGVQNYWEALRSPESYYASGTPSSENIVQYIFYAGMFEVLKSKNYITGVCTWYFDYSKEYSKIKELLSHYLGRVY